MRNASAGHLMRRAGNRLTAVGMAFGAVLMLSAGHPSSDTPLADAVMRGDSAGLRVLLKQGVDVNEVQGDGMTALHWAASRGNLAATRMLVEPALDSMSSFLTRS